MKKSKPDAKKYTGDKSERILVRMNKQLYEKVMANGGSPWIRELIEKARPPRN